MEGTEHRKSLHGTKVSWQSLQLPWNQLSWPLTLVWSNLIQCHCQNQTEGVLLWIFPQVSDSVLGAEAAEKTSLCLHRQTVPSGDKMIKRCFSSLSD